MSAKIKEYKCPKCLEFFYRRIFEKVYRERGFDYEFIKEYINENLSDYSPPLYYLYSTSKKAYIEIYCEYMESNLSLGDFDEKYRLPKGHLGRKFRKFEYPVKDRSQIMKDAWRIKPKNLKNGIEKGKEKREKTLIKKTKKIIDESIFLFDKNAMKIGFKRDWFHEKYPNFIWNIYKEPAWKEKSLEYNSKMNWVCELCSKHSINKDYPCHHIRNFYNNPEIALKDENLQCLCKECHDAITKERKRNYN